MLRYFSDTRNIKNLDTVSFSFSPHPASLNLGSELPVFYCKKPDKNHRKL